MMKKKSIAKSNRWHIHWMLLALFAFCIASCKDNNDDAGKAFDPSQPLVATSMSPTTGGAGTRVILSGSNFGTDASKIKVTVGGVEAKVVGVDKTDMYFIVLNKSYEGTVVVTAVDDNGEALASTELGTKFVYEKRLLVTTLLGTKDEKGNYDIKDGPFNDCGGIQQCSWFSFDPKNPNHLYFTADGNPFRKIDFETKMLTTMFGNGVNNMDRMRSITWTLHGDSMIIATDRGGDEDPSNSVLPRSGGFKTVNVLTTSKQCNGSATHPVNGELYYNSYGKGDFFRFDYPNTVPQTYKGIWQFLIQDTGWEFNTVIHPTGNYAYIVVINQHYILRTDYDWVNKRFTTPYIICGEPRQGGWVDAVGKRARLGRPYQGTFVKNPKYAGQEDLYDFYFAEQDNHDIRILTPQGRISTYAGRGSSGVNTDPWGYIDGDLRKEARFNQPQALIYDEANKCFYVGDKDNRRIRKIGYEE